MDNKQDNMTNFIKPGTKVKTVIGNIDGIITAVTVRGENHILYEISYFSHGEYKAILVMGFEFEVIESNKTQPGFQQHQLGQ